MANALQSQTNGTTKASTPPNQTLYISNLPTSKINKDDLKRSLYCLFSMHGPVLDVVAMRTKTQRGVAHIVFRDVQTSSQALRALQGVEFFGRELRIEYAKGKSNVISRLDGSVKGPEAKTQTQTQTAAAGMTAVQQSVFNNPNASLPSKPAAPGQAPATGNAAEAHGTKRPRDEEEEGEGEPMDEDSGGEAMEESDDD